MSLSDFREHFRRWPLYLSFVVKAPVERKVVFVENAVGKGKNNHLCTLNDVCVRSMENEIEEAL